MSVPFTPQQFFEVMHRYNEGVWPAQLALNALALLGVGLLAVRRAWRDRLIAAVLVVLWLWSGVVYHGRYFYELNAAAAFFGGLFLAGGIAFAWDGMIARRLQFEYAVTARSLIGIALVVYALLVYPLLATATGHGFPQTPTFGTPCPTTIFTIGMLAFTKVPVPRHLFIAPVVWAMIGSQAAFLFGVYEDLGLVVAGAAGAWLALPPNPKARPA